MNLLNTSFILPTISLIALLIFWQKGATTISLFILGALFGAGLNAFQFGFRTCSKQLLTEGKTLGARAVIWLLALTTLLFFPLLGLAGEQFNGFVQPLSLSILIGAFIFGIGMQLAGGCTSGTFNKLGKLHVLSLTSLVFLILGGTLAAYHNDFWQSVPALAAYSIIQHWGWLPALGAQLSVLALFYWGLLKIEGKRHSITPLIADKRTPTQWHPWLKAALALAILNWLHLLIAGTPWSIANVFPYWGIKTIEVTNLPIDWDFWRYGITHQERLTQPLWLDSVSITTLGLLFGAFSVSITHYIKQRRLPEESRQGALRPHIKAMIGGTLMGYGAVIAFGCNIGAFFSGIGSGSLHGWIWAMAALGGHQTGLWLGQKIR